MIAWDARRFELVDSFEYDDADVAGCPTDLKSYQRTAVLLRHAADRPYSEIAAVLDCTEAAARQNVRAGLARLREEISR